MGWVNPGPPGSQSGQAGCVSGREPTSEVLGTCHSLERIAAASLSKWRASVALLCDHTRGARLGA